MNIDKALSLSWSYLNFISSSLISSILSLLLRWFNVAINLKISYTVDDIKSILLAKSLEILFIRYFLDVASSVIDFSEVSSL